MTAQTVGAGFGLVLISLGVLVVTYMRSALAEWRAQRFIADTKDLVKTRTFLRKLRNVKVPEIRLPGHSGPVEVNASGRVPMQRLSSDEWDLLQAEISEHQA